MEAIFNILNYILLSALVIFAIVIGLQKRKEKKAPSSKDAIPGPNVKDSTKNVDYEMGFVQDFLDFEKIYNDMIIRNNGSNFTMVIHCSGINFDLMSENERTMVEEAFIELLNFIQFPIQIYVQTRKVDLKDSLKTYGTKITAIDNELREIADEYTNLKAQDPDDIEQLGMLEYELQRKHNLYEYASDLKKQIERMSVNSNVLQHKYYIVVTYHTEELGLMTKFNEAEIYDMAFGELYTRCQSMIGALAGCDIEAKIVDSNSLAELLYMAFNRDDGELYRLKDNLEAGFYRLYSTTENVLDIQKNVEDYVEEGQPEEYILSLEDGYGLDELSKEFLLESAGEEIEVK